MKYFLLLSALFILAQEGNAQPLFESQQRSTRTFIYEITADQAKHIHQTEFYKIFSDTWLNKLIDTFPADSVYDGKLPAGHYLYVHADRGNLSLEYRQESDIRVSLLNNSRDLNVQVTRLDGSYIPNTRVWLEKKALRYQPKNRIFKQKKSKKEGLLTVEAGGNTFYYQLDNEQRYRPLPAKVITKLAYTPPIRWLWRPWYKGTTDIIRSIKWGNPQGVVRKVWGIFDPYYRNDGKIKQRHQGFVVFSKPKYAPGDTVRLKLWLTKKNGKPIRDELTLKIRQYPNVDDTLSAISPHMPGSYSFSFVPHDSLQLRLDKRVYIEAYRKKRQVIEGSFLWEDYRLEDVSFEARLLNNDHRWGTKQTLKVEAKDANKLPLLDGSVSLMVSTVRLEEAVPDRLFAPDTLWQHTIMLGEDGEETVELPDSIFHDFSATYALSLRLTDANNAVLFKELRGHYVHRKRKDKLTLKLLTDRVQIVGIDTLIKNPILQTLYYQHVDSMEIAQSKTIPLSAYATQYVLKSGDDQVSLDLRSEPSLVQCFAEHLGDSVLIQFANPRKLPLWYHIYKNKRVYREGAAFEAVADKAQNGTYMDFRIPCNKGDVCYITYNYLWAGEEKRMDYTVKFKYHQLTVDVEQPSKIYPGEDVPITVSVSNNSGDPVPFANLTALSYTAKFDRDNLPTFPIHRETVVSRKSLNRYRLEETSTPTWEIPLEFGRWCEKMGLDTVLFYQFLYPGQAGFFLDSAEVPEATRKRGIGQIAPFLVQNGRVKAIHLLYLDHEMVYFRGADFTPNYSFRIESGYHQLKMRTANDWVTIDSVYVPSGKKVTYSFDLNNLPERCLHYARKPKLNEQEAMQLNQKLLQLENTYQGEMEAAFFKQGFQLNMVHLRENMYNSWRKPYLLLGPFRERYLMNVFYPGKFEMETAFEPGFRYTFDEKLVKMVSQLPFIPEGQLLQEVYETPRLGDWAFTLSDTRPQATDTKPVLVKKYRFDERQECPETSQLGRVQVEWKKKLRIKAAIFESLVANSFFHLKPERSKPFVLEGVPSGSYTITFLLDSNLFLQVDSAAINPFGTNFIRLDERTLFDLSDSVHFGFRAGNIRGSVKDSLGYLMVGVKVYSSTDSTQTNIKGHFALQVPDGDSLKVVFRDRIQNFIIADSTGWQNLIFAPPFPLLDEVNVIGQAVMQRRALTGSVSVVNALGRGTELVNYQGIVTEEGTHEPLPGVTIMVKGTATGMVTNLDGEYSLWAEPGATLQFSYIGFITKEQEMGSGRYLDMVLEPDVQQLEEVVVVGYGLQGRVAGVQVVDSSEPTQLSFRGSNSLASSNAPLLIINGVPVMGSLDDIDPNLITSMDVLKSEAATAIYGARAAQGAIIISTDESVGKVPPGLMNNIVAEDGGLLPQQQGKTLRDNFSDEAFWQPHLQTNGQGKAHFSVTFPDDITAWETHVLAIEPGKKKRSGKFEGEIQSYKPLTAYLSVPEFLVKGDSVELRGKAVNYTKEAVSATTSFELNGEQQFSKTASFKKLTNDSLWISAKDTATMKLLYRSQSGSGFLDGEIREVAVISAGTTKEFGQFGILSGDTTLALEGFTTGKPYSLYLQNSMLDVMLQEVEAIREYPYGCNEQLASKLRALLAKEKIHQALKKPFELQKEIKTLINQLMKARNRQGLWGWWPNNNLHYRITNYVVMALLEAAQAGHFQQELLADAAEELAVILPLVSPQERLEILPFLVEYGADLPYERQLEVIAQDTTLTFHQYLELQAVRESLGLPFDSDTLTQTVHKTALGGSFWGSASWIPFDDVTQTTLLAYRLLQGKLDAERQPIIQYFMEKRGRGRWRNTYESAQILAAILPELLQEDASFSPVSVQLKGEGVDKRWDSFPVEWEGITPNSGVLQLKKAGTSPLFFSSTQTDWEEQPEQKGEVFQVTTYFEQDSTLNLQAERGEKLMLTCSLRVTRKTDYVLLEIPIPAGCTYVSKPRNSRFAESYREYYKEKTVVCYEHLPIGTYQLNIPLKTLFKGAFHVNPAKASLMYFPLVFGQEGMKTLKVK